MPDLPVKIHVFDVGQGSSVLVESPSMDGASPKYGIIDCYTQFKGIDPKVLVYLKEQVANRLEFVIITHPDKDHFWGLSSVLEYFTTGGRSVGRLIEGPLTLKSKAFSLLNFAKSSPRYGAEVNELAKINSFYEKIERYETFNSCKGNTLDIIPEIGCDMRVVFPTTEICNDLEKKLAASFGGSFIAGAKQPKQDFNSTCMAFSVKYGSARFLVTGDVCEPSWNTQYESSDLPSDIATVVHHGGSGNPAKLWKKISRARPSKTVAVVSCGSGNNYGHPSAHTLNNVLASHCALFCTEKGNLCKDLDDPSDQALPRVLETVTDKFKGTISRLGGRSLKCSGDLSFELYPTGKVAVTDRERPDAECLYATINGFHNAYDIPLGRKILKKAKTRAK